MKWSICSQVFSRGWVLSLLSAKEFISISRRGGVDSYIWGDPSELQDSTVLNMWSAICFPLRYLPLVNCSLECQEWAEVLQDFYKWRWGSGLEGGKAEHEWLINLFQLEKVPPQHHSYPFLSNELLFIIEFEKSLAKKKRKKTETTAVVSRTSLSNKAAARHIWVEHLKCGWSNCRAKLFTYF